MRAKEGTQGNINIQIERKAELRELWTLKRTRSWVPAEEGQMTEK